MDAAEPTVGPPEPMTLRRPDGRTLAWYEFGDRPGGFPCLYAAGTPASGIAAATHVARARRAGLWLVCPDRPGYGRSDRLRGRTMADWVGDVTALVDHLGIDRFAVLGESGGGPHALAVGHGLSDRVTSVALVAGMGPGDDPAATRGMTRSNARLLRLARMAPAALWPMVALMRRSLLHPTRARRHLDLQLARMPAADRHAAAAHPEEVADQLEAARRALLPGPAGTMDELALLARPWGFALADVVVPVDLWHGTEDRSVPVAIARHVADQLPDCSARYVDGAGHLVSLHVIDEILATLGARAGDPTPTTATTESPGGT